MADARRNPRRWQIKLADCLQALPKLDAASVDVVITDPPYGISFNGMVWDRPRPSTRQKHEAGTAQRPIPAEPFSCSVGSGQASACVS